MSLVRILDTLETDLTWASEAGYRRLWAGVWDWNVASRRVLEKLGFREAGRVEPGLCLRPQPADRTRVLNGARWWIRMRTREGLVRKFAARSRKTSRSQGYDQTDHAPVIKARLDSMFTAGSSSSSARPPRRRTAGT